jgi:hypothetical protein
MEVYGRSPRGWYNFGEVVSMAEREYHPEMLPRRGEVFAWASALIAGLGWWLFNLRGQPVGFFVPLLTVVLVLCGLAISLGNWMDRQTVIRLTDEGVFYKNGLRTVTFRWQDVREVRVFPAHWGKKVMVLGERTFFQFRTLGELSMRGEVKGRIGFARGEEILRQTVLGAGLQVVDHTADGYYYTRE